MFILQASVVRVIVFDYLTFFFIFFYFFSTSSPYLVIHVVCVCVSQFSIQNFQLLEIPHGFCILFYFILSSLFMFIQYAFFFFIPFPSFFPVNRTDHSFLFLNTLRNLESKTKISRSLFGRGRKKSLKVNIKFI